MSKEEASKYTIEELQKLLYEHLYFNAYDGRSLL